MKGDIPCPWNSVTHRRFGKVGSRYIVGEATAASALPLRVGCFQEIPSGCWGGWLTLAGGHMGPLHLTVLRTGRASRRSQQHRRTSRAVAHAEVGDVFRVNQT